MYKLTEVYNWHSAGVPEVRKRDVLVNPAQVTFIRDYGELRRVFLTGGGEGFVDVEESLAHLETWLNVMAVTR